MEKISCLAEPSFVWDFFIVKNWQSSEAVVKNSSSWTRRKDCSVKIFLITCEANTDAHESRSGQKEGQKFLVTKVLKTFDVCNKAILNTSHLFVTLTAEAWFVSERTSVGSLEQRRYRPVLLGVFREDAQHLSAPCTPLSRSTLLRLWPAHRHFRTKSRALEDETSSHVWFAKPNSMLSSPTVLYRASVQRSVVLSVFNVAEESVYVSTA